MYEIISRSDFQTGATLIVKIPEEDLDKKALYTILNDMPDFILPFRHRSIDGKIEFTYQVGSRSKLAHLSGNRTPNEYADLWSGILQPLLDCGDWFMTPYSFVFKPEYLYFDKTKKNVCFVYIPSVNFYSDYDLLKSMITEVAKQNHVTNIELENKVIWAIQDFNPVEFLHMVKQYGLKKAPEKTPEDILEFEQPSEKNIKPKQSLLRHADENKKLEPVNVPFIQKRTDEISINLSEDKKAAKKEKKKIGFLGKKKAQQQEIIIGAAETLKKPESPQVRTDAPVYKPQAPDDDVPTQLDFDEYCGAKLRYIGRNDHPKIIEIEIAEGRIFTIGRFDASVGDKQSSFEFDKKTKAVSRRHAVIERNADGYTITDLSSGAGTFLNGKKIPSNAPFKLEHGCSVSFGHSGADYVWEE